MRRALQAYQAKRDFQVTPEPSGAGETKPGARSYVIQKHWARRLHYDFRIELNGTMKSWAIPKGPSLNPHDKRMAIHVEDHPLSYNKFEGQIPEGQYGAGKVIVWDAGTWEPLGNPKKGYKEGHLKFALHGEKLQGHWALVRMKGRNEKKEAWLLIKEADDFARSSGDYSIVDEMPDSVASTPGKDKESALHRSDRASRKALPQKSQSGNGSNFPKVGNLPPAAKKAELPISIKPQLATLVDVAPADEDAWQYEIKFDGYRLLTRIESSSIRLYTRNGNDWTAHLPALAAALAKMRLPNGWYDGEIVALNERGIPDFQRLQNAFDQSNTTDIVYYLFDLPYCNGYDLRQVSLQSRRAMLQSLLGSKTSRQVQFSEAFAVPGNAIKDNACRLGLEGVIGKRLDASYSDRRSSTWIKLKCQQRQEFVVGGYTDPQGSRTGFGSLLLGVHDKNGKLQYAGNVGTGFDTHSLGTLRKQLEEVEADEKPFNGTTGKYRKVHWVRPILLAEVSFAGWTRDGHIRHGVFHALRSDKRPKNIVREEARHLDAHRTKEGRPLSVKAQKITHPDRIIDESTGFTKLDLIRYYALVAPLMLPHLKRRPTSLLRAPAGIDSKMFFQKHLGEAIMKGVRQLSTKLDPGHPSLLEIADAKGLLSAAQMNVVEFHTWNASTAHIGKPDRIIFDLDPGAKTDWAEVQQAATLVRNFLDELELQSLIKTSGGKGLHIVVPIRRHYEWNTVKEFSRAIVQHLAAALPRQFSAKSGAGNRVGKVFVDYLRNGFGATTVAAWSARARAGMGVSVPIAWKELDQIESGAHWNVRTIHKRFEHGNSAWRKTVPQGLARAMKIFRFEPGDY